MRMITSTTSKKRIDQLFSRTDELDTQLEVIPNEASVSLDYSVGFHYSLVQKEGFVKNLHGLSDDGWRRLQVEERGNVASCNVMGSRRYMQLVRRRIRCEEGESIDEPRSSRPTAPRENEESEEEEEDPPMEDEVPRAIDGRLMGLADMAKQQQGLLFQNACLKILDMTRN